ncbi:S26 family signal peptidase [Sphingobium naphthae]|jgi:conjugative transfer signal peptidase TraF|uniref:S26 family signal peptidase n=1 Tax=Sphingobium naphthae TaxID=1886786 RepID=UPI0037493059
MSDHERRALLRLGDALRLNRDHRLRLRRRAIAVAALVGSLGLTLAGPVRPLLLWNATPSTPVGLYGVSAPHDMAVGDVAIARLPPAWRALADARRYVPAAVPVVKRVAAVPGDTVCARGNAIFIDGRWRAERRMADSHDRLMPWWQGCTTLRDGALFLLNDNPASFDGRYLGPTRRSDVIGRAQLLWAR